MGIKEIKEVVHAYGHKNVQATHPTTLMITKEKHLSKTGDCIIAVAADKAAVDLSAEFKEALKKPNTKVTITIEAGNIKEQIEAHSSPKLTLTNALDIVIRKSEFNSDRTLAVKANKSSKDLPRDFVDKLRDPKQTVKITLVANID